MNAKSTKLIISSIIYVLIIIIAGAAYAYFSDYNIDETYESSINSNSILLTSDDCDKINKSCLSLKYDFKELDSITKNISIKNNGDSTLGYKIVFESIDNTFLDNEVVYVLKDENGNMITSETPLASGKYSNNDVIYDYIIDAGEEYNYELTFIYRGTDVINLDSDKYFKIKLGLVEE